MFQGVLRMLLSAALAAAIPAASVAGGYPDRPIRWLVPFSAGGGSDLATRIVARHVGQALGQPVVVENRPGAATIVAAQEAARAQPDGYTVLTAGMSTLALNPWLYIDLPYDPQADFTPVSTLVALPIVLVTAPDSGLRTLDDVKTYLKRTEPGSYASLGVGSPHHLAMELFMETIGGRATAVPYKGTPPALQDVAAGVVPLMMADLAAARPLIQAGRLQAIAVPSAARSGQLAKVPTFAEAGGSAFEAAAWQGVVAPAGTPAPVVETLSRAIRQALASPDVVKQLTLQGMEPAGSTPQAFEAYARQEHARWGAVIRSKGLSGE
ncbi:MAG: transporter substrate-binding protein [Achromobacter mucicolens]|jgi:tripartite-type tricarboxylate transporter receptor subunit TctC|uniref:Bug family tripartite tricarboxylate transporter substrate binding protein n=1 Tax=Achromobacter mucicolens TaxID=1389922 RepID=UPI0024323E4A|nr:tripartite tricarboxylate transporter substrate binding protein [Achromobacter mucicolens]MDF2862287.1 transporter substrate-binding protein [Achromobacter mucicolens]